MTAPTEQPQHILLVEDNATLRLFAAAMLRRLGYTRLTLAEDGAQAVDVVRTHAVDLVLMDGQLPGVDGWTAAREMRALGFRGAIIGLTAAQDPAERQRCLDAGMDDHLPKPVTLGTLQAMLTHWLSQAPPPVVPAADAGPAAFNAASLHDRFDGDEELMREALASFRTTAPALLAQLRLALAEQRGKDALRHAHSLAGSAALVSADATAALARQMEALAHAGDWPAVHDRLPALAGALDDACRQMPR